MSDFLEQRIIEAVRGLLAGRVNELLGDIHNDVPLIEFGNYNSGNVVVPSVGLVSCEQSEKERIIRHDAYTLTIVLTLPETLESEMFCYAYSGAVSRAVYDNPTLGSVVDRAVITGKKYVPPKKANCGQGWELVLTLRFTVEGNINAG
jgi:hypothetical protein